MNRNNKNSVVALNNLLKRSAEKSYQEKAIFARKPGEFLPYLGLLAVIDAEE
jgi:hypothetical protein